MHSRFFHLQALTLLLLVLKPLLLNFSLWSPQAPLPHFVLVRHVFPSREVWSLFQTLSWATAMPCERKENNKGACLLIRDLPVEFSEINSPPAWDRKWDKEGRSCLPCSHMNSTWSCGPSSLRQAVSLLCWMLSHVGCGWGWHWKADVSLMKKL